ncbi:hypothetical protein FTUN_7856 [Frigoriglobus tundricola]|uniref:Uncharacterized protein n=1 Tax=Frigoriglobus tundricola TaxID=2774151 RepID=A0A6M5Z448_9BACT|nr:hypothetical protein FTUN_7856 [Frigoriglobus tundricola]
MLSFSSNIFPQTLTFQGKAVLHRWGGRVAMFSSETPFGLANKMCIFCEAIV